MISELINGELTDNELGCQMDLPPEQLLEMMVGADLDLDDHLVGLCGDELDFQLGLPLTSLPELTVGVDPDPDECLDADTFSWAIDSASQAAESKQQAVISFVGHSPNADTNQDPPSLELQSDLDSCNNANPKDMADYYHFLCELGGDSARSSPERQELGNNFDPNPPDLANGHIVQLNKFSEEESAPGGGCEPSRQDHGTTSFKMPATTSPTPEWKGQDFSVTASNAYTAPIVYRMAYPTTFPHQTKAIEQKISSTPKNNTTKAAASPTFGKKPAGPRKFRKVEAVINGLDLPTAEDEESRKLRCKLRNRENARRFRERKKRELESYIEQKVAKEEEISRLRELLAEEQGRMEMLKQVVQQASLRRFQL